MPLLIAVLASVLVVTIETVEALSSRYGSLSTAIEWAVTILFTGEYAARLSCVERPLRYARSFFGAVDLASCCRCTWPRSSPARTC